MARYKIEVPKASAKRMEKGRKLVIEVHYGWSGSGYFPFVISDDVDFVEFDFEFDEHARNKNIIDGTHYICYFQYKNSTGSRIEKIPFDWRTL